MIFHNAYLHKAFFSVNYFMDVQMTMPEKGFSTMFACISLLLLCSVALFMTVTPTGFVEDFLQYSCIRFLCSVTPFVSVMTTGIGEGFSTMLTCIRLLPSVNSFINVLIETTGKGFYPM